MKFNDTILELMVRDVPETMGFYQQVLGFEVVATDQEQGLVYWAEMRLGNFRISFKEEKRLKREADFFANMAIGGSIAICLVVDDIQIAYADISQKLQTLNHPHLTPCGIREFSLRDVNGYVITLEQVQ